MELLHRMTTAMISRAFLMSALLLVAVAVSAQRNGVAEKQCYEKSSHAEARECLESYAKQSAQALRSIEVLILSNVNKWDQEPIYASRAASAFEAAASQFLRYRQSQCEFQASLAAGGNGTVDRRLLCEIDLNNKRIAELQPVQGFLQ